MVLTLSRQFVTLTGTGKAVRVFFLILHNEPTNAQLFNKLSRSSYMFRQYHVILRELVVSTLLSYTSMSNAAVGNTVKYYFT